MAEFVLYASLRVLTGASVLAPSESGWRPGIGDPTFMGWLTVVLYFATAGICCLAGSHQPKAERKLSRFWYGLGLFMCALGVNKQLDLQSGLTEIGRWLAHSQGWYEQRHLVQRAMIIAVSSGGLLIVALVVWVLRNSARTLLLALVGLVFLLTFIVLRASSFHHVDLLIDKTILGARLNWIFEIGGIGLIAYAAMSAASRKPNELTSARANN